MMKKTVSLLLPFLPLLLCAQSETSLLTGIARDAIVQHVTGVAEVDRAKLIHDNPYLLHNGATFVTLSKAERLRGCIGSLQAFRPLVDDIVSNAQSAAFSDPRFMALERKELSRLEIEVSLLSEPTGVGYDDVKELKEQIRVGEDGIVLQYGQHRATYLPQVWEQLPRFEEFFSSLCEKANLNANCLSLKPKIYGYHVQKFSEADLTKRPVSNAGRFYPKRCDATQNYFKTFDARALREEKSELTQVPSAIIVPHAGYMYSGYSASLVYKLAAKSRAKRVVIVGPSHRQNFRGVSIAEYETFPTPCGLLRNDLAYVTALKKSFGLRQLDAVFEQEHSTEVQLPFINYYMPEKKVVELVYGDISVKGLSKLLSTLLSNSDNLVVVSSDLSHFYTQKEAQKRDFICLEGVEKGDAKTLQKGCEACGYTGIEALLRVAKKKGLKSKLVDYRTSADATGDTQRVVGYMSAVFW